MLNYNHVLSGSISNSTKADFAKAAMKAGKTPAELAGLFGADFSGLLNAAEDAYAALDPETQRNVQASDEAFASIIYPMMLNA